MLCLPFAPHEIPHARELVKLWADMEDTFNNEVTLLLASRNDLETHCIGQDIIDYAQTKFKVILHKCRRPGVGWPHGCNQLEVGVYEWFVEENRSGNFDFPYLFLAETDTVPTRKGWLREIMNEAYDNNISILGAYFTAEDGLPHINGNCVLHRDFWLKSRCIWTISPSMGWDVAIGKQAMQYGTPSRLIWQDYRLGMPDNPWRNDDHLFAAKRYNAPTNPLHGQDLFPAFIHGCKTRQAIDAVRKRVFTTGEKV